jgi:hypothetical protein
MKYDKRMRALQSIYEYLVMQRLEHAEVTASDIVIFHRLPRECSYTLAATMKYVHNSGKAMHGFHVTEVRRFKKNGSPARYTIELVKGIAEFKHGKNSDE